jgi:hypothetical protein
MSPSRQRRRAGFEAQAGRDREAKAKRNTEIQVKERGMTDINSPKGNKGEQSAA